MELPENVEAWTYETVLEVVRRYEYEPALIDFKEVLTPEQGTSESKKAHTESIQRTIAAMANTDGGYILFGVVDRNNPVPQNGSRVQGISRRSDLRKQIGDKLEGISPPVQFEMSVVEVPGDPTRGILIVHVPLSQRRPHQCSNLGKFYRRDSGGKAVHMNVYEVRDQMLYSGKRMQQVTLLRLEILSYRRLVGQLRDPNIWFARLDTSSFKVLLAEICDLLPNQGQLLFTLHGIATIAVTLNSALEAAHPYWMKSRFIPTALPFHPGVKLRDGMRITLDDFERTCAIGEEGLQEIFGPLGVETAMRDDQFLPR